jgi:hypothetical protein
LIGILKRENAAFLGKANKAELGALGKFVKTLERGQGSARGCDFFALFLLSGGNGGGIPQRFFVMCMRKF